MGKDIRFKACSVNYRLGIIVGSGHGFVIFSLLGSRAWWDLLRTLDTASKHREQKPCNALKDYCGDRDAHQVIDDAIVVE